jgi:hypothetical protein
MSLRNPFEMKPLLEREEKSIGMTSTQDIFKNFESEKNTMSFQDTCKILNDLAFVLIPFDKTEKSF